MELVLMLLVKLNNVNPAWQPLLDAYSLRLQRQARLSKTGNDVDRHLVLLESFLIHPYVAVCSLAIPCKTLAWSQQRCRMALLTR